MVLKNFVGNWHNQSDVKLKAGDLVWVIEPDTPRGHYPPARILKLNYGKDGCARSADIKTVILLFYNCFYMHLHAFVLSLTFALQHPPPLNKEERERALRSGGSVRSDGRTLPFLVRKIKKKLKSFLKKGL